MPLKEGLEKTFVFLEKTFMPLEKTLALLERTFALLGERFAYSGAELLTVAGVDDEIAFLAKGLSMFSLGAKRRMVRKEKSCARYFTNRRMGVGEVFNAQKGVRYRHMSLLFFDRSILLGRILG